MRQLGDLPPACQPALGIFQIRGEQLDRRFAAFRADLGRKDGTAAEAAQVFSQRKLTTDDVAFPLFPSFSHFAGLHHLTCLSGLL